MGLGASKMIMFGYAVSLVHCPPERCVALEPPGYKLGDGFLFLPSSSLLSCCSHLRILSDW